ncbi:MAG: chalcone isomerase family protein [Proteobacteria bacterium]|nr:chalcone isomerase family protein [Pseudomonadota bacterium]
MGMALALGMGAAHARECNGIPFPDRVQVGGAELALNGLGIRKATFFKVRVYVAALYVATPGNDPNTLIAAGTPVELTLHFVRNVSVDELTNAWKEGFSRNAGGRVPALSERIARLNSWMTSIKAGQHLTFIRRPGAGIEVDVNGTVRGTIEGDDFANAFLSIWLGAEPPNPELKSGLLGGACG